MSEHTGCLFWTVRALLISILFFHNKWLSSITTGRSFSVWHSKSAENVQNTGKTRNDCFNMTMHRRLPLCQHKNFLAVQNKAVLLHHLCSFNIILNYISLFLATKLQLREHHFQNFQNVADRPTRFQNVSSSGDPSTGWNSGMFAQTQMETTTSSNKGKPLFRYIFHPGTLVYALVPQLLRKHTAV